MPEWEDQPSAAPTKEEADRSPESKQEKKREKGGRNGKTPKKEEESTKEPQKQPLDPHKAKLNEVLSSAEWYLKQSLMLLEQ